MSELGAFVNRLRKNARHWSKWARREGLEAYRIYDRDMPEFPYVIDRYGESLHVQLFVPRKPIGETTLADHMSAIATALDVSGDQLALKIRQRQRGSAQYERLNRDGPTFVVREGDLRFEVNLRRYLDTGLFLDHRNTRAMVRERAAGKTLLNLFAYTGSFTVYAAAGGALRTVTVDMSKTYQDWTRRNLRLNGLDDGDRHLLVREDVNKYLARAQRAKTRFDLIVLDPPSFSNSKRMQVSFDIQRDHPQLLRQTLNLLAPDGQLFFSTNRRGFKLDAILSDEILIEEVTHRTLPEDFRRHTAHRCWVLRHTVL